ncbi:tetratricopeptide repeat protein [Kordiimonas aestuarii]|uniref:tetratricopeptide repeat protein n=1 Tax=Kordiimonas aestuarii TaxID=1005925 RepID=UPI0021D30B51|nr:tetratricopeptide repeat protein [Kordiimonas aestuarii]
MRKLLFCLFVLVALPSHASDPEEEQVFLSLRKEAPKGDSEAQYYLGMMYHVGIATDRDYQKAYALFAESAKAGHPLSAYKVGCYYAGQGGGILPVDQDLALKYKLIAAEAGYSFAQNDVALIFLQQQKFDNAVKWTKSAADQGYANAIAMLASFHADGILVKKDRAKAQAYLRIALRQAGARLTPEVVGFLKQQEALMSEEEVQRTNAIFDGWVARPTEITVKATHGLRSASDYLLGKQQ